MRRELVTIRQMQPNRVDAGFAGVALHHREAGARGQEVRAGSPLHRGGGLHGTLGGGERREESGRGESKDGDNAHVRSDKSWGGDDRPALRASHPRFS